MKCTHIPTCHTVLQCLEKDGKLIYPSDLDDPVCEGCCEPAYACSCLNQHEEDDFRRAKNERIATLKLINSLNKKIIIAKKALEKIQETLPKTWCGGAPFGSIPEYVNVVSKTCRDTLNNLNNLNSD